MATFSPGEAPLAQRSGLPAVTREATALSFTTLVNFDGSALLPETLDKKVKRFGNRSISGLLSKMAAEYALSSDLIQWTEDNRLHIKSIGITRDNVLSTTLLPDRGRTFTFPQGHGFRVGQSVMLVQTVGGAGDAGTVGTEGKGLIRSISGTGNETVLIDSYGAQVGQDAGFLALGNAAITAIVYGSEFAKGTTGMRGTLETTYVNRSNEPIIMKDHFSVTGSDVAQIGWIEVSDVNGDGGHGYLWYLQSELDERARFMDDLETAMVEAVPAATNSPAAGQNGISGTRGLFYELDQYGSTFTGGFNAGSTPAAALTDFDNIIKQLDTQGNIEENSLYLNRDQSLAFDNFLGNQSDYSNAGGGPSWGSFSNSSDMALTLGFSGVRRGDYDFYKTSWKYLNDVQARRDFTGGGTAAVANIQGIMCPMGSSSVYDEMLSKTVTRPYMHIRYRASEVDNRKLKTWVTGSVGGTPTSDLDAMEIHYLSERCLVIQATNNFGIFKRV